MPQAVAAAWSAAAAVFGGTAFGQAAAGSWLAVANAGAQFAANVALAVAVNSVVANNTKPKDQGGLIDLTLDSSAPRRLIIGKRMTGGVLVDWYLAGSNNTKLYLPVYLSEGPCGQITRVFAGGRQVWSTPLVHGVRTTIPDFRSGGDRLWLTYYDGRVGQTADATLVGLSQGWTSANKMTGCAWVLVECQWDSDNLRQPPQLTFEMEGAKLYDRRLDTTAGGSGSHRADDPSTWEWSDNPMVALDHFLLGRYWDGRRTFGIGLSSDEVPYDRFAAQANVCDEDVDLKAGGTQKRYRANGFVFASDDYANTISNLCTAMAARAADFGGRFGVIGIESKTPVLTIDDADVIDSIAEIYTPKRSWSELVGAVEGRFQDPAQLYQPVDYPRVTDDAWEDEDGGEPKVLTLDLEFETDVERAQRLALLKARAERRQATLKGSYPLWTIELERGDWFIRTGAKWGEDGKTFEVIERILDPVNFTVSIVAQEVDPDDSAWDETTASDGPPAPIASTDELSSVSAPALTVTSNPIVGAASNTPAIKVAFTNPTDPRVHTLFVEVTRDSDGLKVATVPVSIPDDDEEVIIQNGIADGVDYNVRAKFLTPGLQSDWSDTEAVTTGATYAVGEADSVAWSNVTDDGGRPDDDADVTSANTAAAIAGQGSLATRNVPNVVDTRASNEPPSYYLALTPGIYEELKQVSALSLPGAVSGSFVRLTTRVQWSDLTGGPVVQLADAENGVWMRRSSSTSAWTAWAKQYDELQKPYFGADILESSGGATATLSNFKTVLGTAAAITSQGGLATLNFTTLGTNVRLADGSTSATNALLVTSLGTAAAIASQGDLATANRASLPFGQNAVINSELLGTRPFGWGINGKAWPGNSGLTPSWSMITSGPRRAFKIAITGTPANGTVADFGNSGYSGVGTRCFLPVVPGEVVGASALVAGLNCSGVHVTIGWANAAGSYIAEDAGSDAGMGVDGSAADPSTYGLSTSVATAPANARYAYIWIRAVFNGSANPQAWAMSPMLCRLPSGQSVVPPYSPGGTDRVADETSNNTAAAIASQGALATLGQVNLGASGRVYRDDGTTRLTDALAVTSLGTAAAIAGQTAWATLSTATAYILAPRQNLITYPSGKGNNAAASSIGWAASGGATPDSPLFMADYGPGGGRYFFESWSSGYNSGSGRFYTYEIATAPGVFTVSMIGETALTGVVFYVQAYNGSTWLAESSQVAISSSVRNSATVTAPSGTTKILVAVMIPAQNSSGVYREIRLRDIKLEAGSTATAFINERRDVENAADVTASHTAAAIASQGGLATLSFVTIGTNLRRADGATSATEALIVTSLGTASAIASQGDLATTNRASLPFGVNALVNTEWPSGTPPLGWTTGWDGTTGLSAVRTAVQRDRRALKAAITGTPSNATVFDITSSSGRDNLVNAARYAVPCAAGDRFGIGARVACENATSVAAGVVWLDAAAAYISESYVTGAGAGIDGDTVDSASYALSSGVVTAPTGARWVVFNARVTCSGAANPEAWLMSPMICRLPSGQTIVPDYHPGPPDRNSDKTGDNTAAAIASQGSLATLSFVTLGTNVRLADGSTSATNALLVTSLGTASAVSGQGALCTLNYVQFNSTVRLQDGTTIVTDALVVTASGTAAAIAGQGSLATLNDAGVFGYATPTSGNLTNSYVSKASKSVTTDGGPVEIELSAFFQRDNPLLEIDNTTEVTILCKIKRDSTELVADLAICGWVYLALSGAGWMTAPVQHGRVLWVDNPSAGTYTYSIELKCSVDDDGVAPPASMLSGGKVFRIFNPQGGANAVSGP